VIELTEEQRLQLNTELPRVLDPATLTRYVLVKEEVYERLEALLVPERLTLSEQQAVLRAAGQRAGWDDRDMEVYDREEPHNNHERPAW
jgi:hypothetical protein